MEQKLQRPVLLEIAVMDFFHSSNHPDIPIMVNKANIIRQIARKAITDSKTRAFSADQLKIDVQKEIERNYRYGIPFSVIMIDLDNFKYVNDSFGHQKGDEVLRFISSLIEKNLRKLDSLYRFGGDEFVILLPQTDLQGAGSFAAKLSSNLKSAPCKAISQIITVSMGVAAYGSYHSNSYTDLIESADKALYRAKAEGKNMIVFSIDGKLEFFNGDQGERLL